MISSIDPKLTIALGNLRKNPTLNTFISEMEVAGLTVFIFQAPPTSSNSYTDVNHSPKYSCYINTKGDASVALFKWGITLTTEENSIAHELGHVYFDYLLNIKKKPGLVSSPPTGATAAQWQDIMDESISRRFELSTRPPGTIIPLKDPVEESVWKRLDFTPFPLSLFKN
jgi:hypothetical protein